MSAISLLLSQWASCYETGKYNVWTDNSDKNTTMHQNASLNINCINEKITVNLRYWTTEILVMTVNNKHWTILFFMIIKVVENWAEQGCNASFQQYSLIWSDELTDSQVDYERGWGEETSTTATNTGYQSDQPHTDHSVNGSSSYVERELQLGGVWFNQLQRPSSYQPPLYTFTVRYHLICNHSPFAVHSFYTLWHTHNFLVFILHVN